MYLFHLVRSKPRVYKKYIVSCIWIKLLSTLYTKNFLAKSKTDTYRNLYFVYCDEHVLLENQRVMLRSSTQCGQWPASNNNQSSSKSHLSLLKGNNVILDRDWTM